MNIQSKFPDIGENIFTTISLEANKHKDVINLGQGFPNFDAHPYLLERTNHYINSGANQYSPMMGRIELREQISLMHERIYKTKFDPKNEVTVTAGATEAIFCAISSVINPGDEVIVFDPAYDSYNPNIRMNGGVPVHINIDLENMTYDWNLVRKKITSKTKLIILNTPHNPTGIVFSENDLNQLWEIVKSSNIFILCDEVYQHIIFDNKKHLSPINDERMMGRTFSISSFGKSFHVTGWKIGYCIAPKELTDEFRKIHQYTTFCSFHPIQLSIADMMSKHSNYFEELSQFYQIKRDQFLSQVRRTKLKPLVCEGSYFLIADYSELSSKADFDFCLELIKEKKIAAIPLSALYASKKDQKLIRFCFAKTEDILSKSLNSLIK